MACLLHIETASAICSVALSRNGELLGLRESSDARPHASLVTLFARDCLAGAGLVAADLDAVALSAGPGSFTGLRIGASVAKGLCYALDIPLIAADSLHILLDAVTPDPHYHIFCAVTLARNNFVFAAARGLDGSSVLGTCLLSVDSDLFVQLCARGAVLFFGSGVDALSSRLRSPGACFSTGVLPSAGAQIRLTLEKFRSGDFSDHSRFEPNYFLDFGF